MSFTDLRPYFRACIAEADKSLVEWTDGFNEDNIPKTVIDKKCFHIVVGKFKTTKLNQPLCCEFTGDATIKLYFDGMKHPQKTIDDIIAKGQKIVERCLIAKNRATQPSIKNLVVTDFDPSPLSRSNDNVVRLTIDFSLVIVLELPTS